MSIRGSIIRLSPPEAEDLFALQSLRNDLSLQRQLLALPKPNNMDAVREWIGRFNGSSNAILFSIRRLDNDLCIGFVQVTQIDTLHGTGWLGVAIDPEYQGKGFGGEALKLIERYMHEFFNLRKLLLEVDSKNPAKHLYTRMGYSVIGTMRSHFYHGDRYHDIDIMEKFL